MIRKITFVVTLSILTSINYIHCPEAVHSEIVSPDVSQRVERETLEKHRAKYGYFEGTLRYHFKPDMKSVALKQDKSGVAESDVSPKLTVSFREPIRPEAPTEPAKAEVVKPTEKMSADVFQYDITPRNEVQLKRAINNLTTMDPEQLNNPENLKTLVQAVNSGMLEPQDLPAIALRLTDVDTVNTMINAYKSPGHSEDLGALLRNLQPKMLDTVLSKINDDKDLQQIFEASGLDPFNKQDLDAVQAIIARSDELTAAKQKVQEPKPVEKFQQFMTELVALHKALPVDAAKVVKMANDLNPEDLKTLFTTMDKKELTNLLNDFSDKAVVLQQGPFRTVDPVLRNKLQRIFNDILSAMVKK